MQIFKQLFSDYFSFSGQLGYSLIDFVDNFHVRQSSSKLDFALTYSVIHFGHLYSLKLTKNDFILYIIYILYII